MSKRQQLLTDSFQQQKVSVTRSSKRIGNKPKSSDKIDEANSSTSRSNSDILRVAELNILRKFDVEMNYGPCTGITRLERWERADRNGFSPPDKIKQVILKHENDPEYTDNLWHDYPL